MSGPLFRLLEEEGHVFQLNNVWLQLKLLFERCSENSSVLLEGDSLLPNGKITKDDIYIELFRDSENLELDTLTQECLEIICSSCLVLVNHQLADQLPGGIFYLPMKKLSLKLVSVLAQIFYQKLILHKWTEKFARNPIFQ